MFDAKHGYGMTSGKQRRILEVGVGPKVSLLPLQQIRHRFDGVRDTIYHVKRRSASPAFTKVVSEIRPATVQAMTIHANGEQKLFEFEDTQDCDYVKLEESGLSNRSESGIWAKPNKIKMEKAFEACDLQNKQGHGCNAISDYYNPHTHSFPIYRLR